MARNARSCHAVSSGDRAPRFEPDFDKASDVPWDAEGRQEPLDGLPRKFLELLPQTALQDGLEDRPQELRLASHVDGLRAAIPCPDLHATSHGARLARLQSTQGCSSA